MGPRVLLRRTFEILDRSYLRRAGGDKHHKAPQKTPWPDVGVAGRAVAMITPRKRAKGAGRKPLPPALRLQTMSFRASVETRQSIINLALTLGCNQGNAIKHAVSQAIAAIQN